MKISQLTLLILAATVVYGCKKPAATVPGTGTNQLGGTYTGQLIADYKASDTWRTGPVTSNVTVSFANRNYGAVTIPTTRYFGGYRGTADSGKYVLQSNQLTLADSAAYPQLFDQNLILQGSYSVTFKADSLILNKTIYGNDYTYKLKKD